MSTQPAVPTAHGKPDLRVVEGRGGSSRDLRKTGLHPDFWYPLARAAKLARGKMMPVAFAGEPIVLVRGEDGVAYALENRCAHRQVPLHLGVVHKNKVQCGYHRWTYDRTGHCVNVPYLGEGKCLPNGVKGYPTREAHGFVWVFPGDPAKLETAAFPNISTYADPGYKTRVLDREVACHWSFMHENLMDMNHQFLHRRLMGGIKTVAGEHREGDSWMDADYTFRRTSGRQPIGEAFIIQRPGSVDPSGKSDVMTIRTKYPYQTLEFWTAGSEMPALSVWNVYVPTDAEQRKNHTFGLLMVRKPNIPGLIHVLWPAISWFTEKIFREDKAIVEHEQRAFDAQGADWNNEISPIIQGLRRVLAKQSVALGA